MAITASRSIQATLYFWEEQASSNSTAHSTQDINLPFYYIAI